MIKDGMDGCYMLVSYTVVCMNSEVVLSLVSRRYPVTFFLLHGLVYRTEEIENC